MQYLVEVVQQICASNYYVQLVPIFAMMNRFEKPFERLLLPCQYHPVSINRKDVWRKQVMWKLTLVPSSTRQISSPVLGLITGKVLPFTALCHSLLMKICVYLMSIFGTFEVNEDIYNMNIGVVILVSAKYWWVSVLIFLSPVCHHSLHAFSTFFSYLVILGTTTRNLLSSLCREYIFDRSTFY